MPKSEYVKNLDALQAHIAAFLKPLGFRKKGRTHNRTSEGGLIQVVNYQMGEYPLGEHYVVPGLRENCYGKFTVNLGVLVPAVYETTWQKPIPDFTPEYVCTVRERLSTLAFGTDDWFKLTSDIPSLASKLVQMFDRFGLPFFEQFPDHQSVLAYYDTHGVLPFQNDGRATFEAAIIAHHLGNADRAQRLFAKALDPDHKGFSEYVSSTANRLGYQVP